MCSTSVIIQQCLTESLCSPSNQTFQSHLCFDAQARGRFWGGMWSVMLPISCLLLPPPPRLHLAKPGPGLFAHMRKLQVAGHSGRQRGGGGNTTPEPTGEQTWAEPTIQTIQTSPSSLLHHHTHLALNLHYTIRFKSALGSARTAERGQRSE